MFPDNGYTAVIFMNRDRLMMPVIFKLRELIPGSVTAVSAGESVGRLNQPHQLPGGLFLSRATGDGVFLAVR